MNLIVRISVILFSVFLVGCATQPSASQPSETTQDNNIRLLLVGDPFALAIQQALPELEAQTDQKIEVEIVGYDEVRTITLRNARDKNSAYDLVSFDVVWMGEYGENNVLLPLDELIASSTSVTPDDFLEVAYQGSNYQEQQLGLPIQPHAELLWYRTDLFEDGNLTPPTTTDEVLSVAETLTDVENEQYGIVWNAQRGQALGQTMAHFYASFGQPLLDEAGQPTLNTPQGVAAAEYAMALLPYSPPDITTIAWDQRIERFARGHVAMTYGWGARSYLVEDDPRSKVSGQVGYLAAPHQSDVTPVTPTGTWSLGIPANIGDRSNNAWNFLEFITSPAGLTLLAEQGNGGAPRYSLLNNTELINRYPTFPVMASLGQSNQLDAWMRPAVPQWSQLADILGTVYHDMLLGTLTPAEAAEIAQEEAEVLFGE